MAGGADGGTEGVDFAGLEVSIAVGEVDGEEVGTAGEAVAAIFGHGVL